MKIFGILKQISILFTLVIITDLVTCQGGGMGSDAGAGVGAGANMGGGMNGGMGESGALGHGPPKKMALPGRNFHTANNNPRGFMNIAYPEYKQINKRSIMTVEPMQQNSDDNISQRNKRYTVLVMPHEENHPKFNEIPNNNKMRSKRTPEHTSEEENLENENDNSDDVSDTSSSSSSSYSDSNEENEQNYNNNINKRNRRRAMLNYRNSGIKNDHQSLYKNDMHSIPIMEINKQSIIRKSFGNFVQ